MDKLKEGVSVQEVEDFARKYAVEVVSVGSIVLAAISSMFDFFTGPSLSVLFLTIGTILGIFFPVPVENGLKQAFGYAFKQEKSTQLILAGVKIVIALFIPFLLFGIIGLLSGTAYHYFARHAQVIKEHKPSKKQKAESHDGEHE